MKHRSMLRICFEFKIGNIVFVKLSSGFKKSYKVLFGYAVVLMVSGLGQTPATALTLQVPYTREAPQISGCTASIIEVCKSIGAKFLNTAPKLDGVISDGEYAGAAVITDFHQLRPNEFAQTSQSTTVYLGYDADNLYVAAYMHETDPGQIVARKLIDGASLNADDIFTVLISPFNNGRTGYAFNTNPNGVRSDALLEGPNNFNDNWKTIWKSRATITDDGWIAEMVIPFKSINFNPGNNTWGVSFARDLASRNEVDVWTSREQINSETLGELRGVTGARQGLGLDIVPNLSVRQRHNEETGRDSFAIEPGLDATYNITPSLTATVTVNTDFSTTDVDDQIVNLSRFSIFLPERRDFFLQDADIFNFGNIGNNARPFFSRRVGLDENANPIDLKFGAKITGRVGPVSIGVLDVVQEKGGEGETGDANLLVARSTVDVLDGSTLGAIVAHGNPLNGDNSTTFGADFLFRDANLIPGRRVIGEFWWQQANRPGITDNNQGFGAFLELPAREGFEGFINYRRLEEDYDPALGFVNRTGNKRINSRVAYNWRPETGLFNRISTFLFAERFNSIGGGVESEFLHFTPIQANFRDGGFFRFAYNYTREILFEDFEIVEGVIIPVGDYNWENASFRFSTPEQNKLRLSGGAGYGDFFSGTSFNFNLNTLWRPSKHLAFSASYRQNDVDFGDDGFITRIVSLRSDVAFNSAFSWITRFQFDNVSDEGGINSRLRYQIEPGQDIFLVFNQGFIRDEFSTGELDENGTINRRPSRLRLTDSDLTLRVAYTFRF